jgi:uncharacterized protein (TIGR02271 family)
MSGIDGRPEDGREPRDAAEEAVVTRSEEELLVRRAWRQRERVRVRTRVVTETRTYSVELRREELVIEREPMEEPSTASSEPEPYDGPLEIVLHEEEAVVHKRVVPRERVRVHRERITEGRPVRADIRRERLEIEAGAEAAVRRPAP